MKRLLSYINLILFFSSILACPGMKNNVPAEVVPDITMDTIFIDTLMYPGDSITGKSIDPVSDSTSKDVKYEKGKGKFKEIPKHHTPDDAKLDSIKKSKEKLKKG
jgi:hypothetical protein